MALFKRNFDKPGPGVPKNAPRKKGIPRFFEVVARDFGNLVKLNLIYAVSVLPAQILAVVTAFSWGTPSLFLLFGMLTLVASIPVGPSTTAMYYILSKMLRDDPGFVWHDYKRQFKENFRSTAIPGILYVVVLVSQVFGAMFYPQMQGAIGIAMVAVYLFSVLLFSMAASYFFTQSAYLDLGTIGRLKNSLLLAMGYAPRSFMGALLGTGLVVVQFLFFPIATVVTIFIGYTIPGLLCLMWVWPPLDKTFEIEKTLKKRATSEEDDPQAETEEEQDADAVAETEKSS